MEYSATLDSVEKLTSQNWLGADPYDAVEAPSPGATASLRAAPATETSERSLLCLLFLRQLTMSGA